MLIYFRLRRHAEAHYHGECARADENSAADSSRGNSRPHYRAHAEPLANRRFIPDRQYAWPSPAAGRRRRRRQHAGCRSIFRVARRHYRVASLFFNCVERNLNKSAGERSDSFAIK